MPLYEYGCECGHSFEAIKLMYDRHDAICPICNSHASLRMSAWGRVIVAGTFQVVDSSGRVLESKPTVENIPYQGVRYANRRDK